MQKAPILRLFCPKIDVRKSLNLDCSLLITGHQVVRVVKEEGLRSSAKARGFDPHT